MVRFFNSFGKTEFDLHEFFTASKGSFPYSWRFFLDMSLGFCWELVDIIRFVLKHAVILFSFFFKGLPRFFKSASSLLAFKIISAFKDFSRVLLKSQDVFKALRLHQRHWIFLGVIRPFFSVRNSSESLEESSIILWDYFKIIEASPRF